MQRTRATWPSSVSPKLLMSSSDRSHNVALGRSLTPAASASAPAASAWSETQTAHISTVFAVSGDVPGVDRLHQPSAHVVCIARRVLRRQPARLAIFASACIPESTSEKVATERYTKYLARNGSSHIILNQSNKVEFQMLTSSDQTILRRTAFETHCSGTFHHAHRCDGRVRTRYRDPARSVGRAQHRYRLGPSPR